MWKILKFIARKKKKFHTPPMKEIFGLTPALLPLEPSPLWKFLSSFRLFSENVCL